ncbi:MAG TPA: NTP transferase domain-containing protein [Acidimicrobiales bacterium]|nr:NTP transferase domain-containing protein [Acidimicrobiales bacterium]
MTIAGVVLAAGAATRFGPTHKLLSDFRGKPLVAWVIEAVLAAGLDEVIVVTGAIDLGELVPAGAYTLRNPRWAQGQATSLAAGVAAAAARAHEAVVVGLGDQPLIPTEAWRLVAACDERPIAVATYAGQRRNPVRLAAAVWPLLPIDGDEGARTLIRSRTDLVAEVPCPGDPADIDTQKDLATWN